MARPKLDPDALREFLAAGHSQAAAAIEFGVSEAAISQRVKSLRLDTSKIVAFERAADVIDVQLTAASRLDHVQDVIRQQLDYVERLAQSPGANRAAFTDPLVKLSGEVRAQVRLSHDISKDLVQLQVMQEFRRVVFEVITQEAPETAHRIVERLKQQRALRQSLQIAPPVAFGGSDAA
jgi:hypothetical protein